MRFPVPLCKPGISLKPMALSLVSVQFHILLIQYVQLSVLFKLVLFLDITMTALT